MIDLFRNRVITRTDWIITGIAGAVLLVIVLLNVFLIRTTLANAIEQTSLDRDQRQQQVAEARLVASKEEGLRRENEEVGALVEEFKLRLPTEQEIPRLLENFQMVAAETGVKYQSITAMPLDESPSLYVKIPFRLIVTGSYAQIGSFLERLEFGKRFIKIEDISIGPEKEDMNETKLSLSTYMFIEKEGESRE